MDIDKIKTLRAEELTRLYFLEYFYNQEEFTIGERHIELHAHMPLVKGFFVYLHIQACRLNSFMEANRRPNWYFIGRNERKRLESVYEAAMARLNHLSSMILLDVRMHKTPNIEEYQLKMELWAKDLVKDGIDLDGEPPKSGVFG